jgi:hypothetical protein
MTRGDPDLTEFGAAGSGDNIIRTGCAPPSVGLAACPQAGNRPDPWRGHIARVRRSGNIPPFHVRLCAHFNARAAIRLLAWRNRAVRRKRSRQADSDLLKLS